MLSRLSIFVLLALAALPANGGTLKGVILANELSGQPLENVDVDAVSGTNHTESDSSGKFTLEFPQMRVGETVHVIVKKAGYVVVNDVQLQLVLPADPVAAPLIILLAKESDREEMARRFYRIKNSEAVDATYQQKLKELEDEHRADAAALAQVQQERDQARAAIAEASEQLAKDAPGQNSGIYQQAKRLFLDGKSEEAVRYLADEKIRDEKNGPAAISTDNAVQAWLLKAQLLTVQFRFQDAEKAYLQAIDAKPDSYEANFAYALFNQGLNRFEPASTFYNRCLGWARQNGKDAEAAATFVNLGNLNFDRLRAKEARQDYAEALEIYRRLSVQDEARVVELAATLNNLGELDRSQNRLKEAQQELEEALQIRRRLAQQNPALYLPGLAETLANLGNVNVVQQQAREARKQYGEALKIYRELVQQNPEVHLLGLSSTLSNLGLLDLQQNMVKEAQQELEEALQIRRQLARQNPEAFLPSVPQTLGNLVSLDVAQRQWATARQRCDEMLQILEKLAQGDPERYSPEIMKVQRELEALPKSTAGNDTQDQPREVRVERTGQAEKEQMVGKDGQTNPQFRSPNTPEGRPWMRRVAAGQQGQDGSDTGDGRLQQSRPNPEISDPPQNVDRSVTDPRSWSRSAGTIASPRTVPSSALSYNGRPPAYPTRQSQASPVASAQGSLILRLNSALDVHDYATLLSFVPNGRTDYFGHRNATSSFIEKDMQGDARNYRWTKSNPDLSTFRTFTDTDGVVHESIQMETAAQENSGKRHHAFVQLDISYRNEDPPSLLSIELRVIK